MDRRNFLRGVTGATTAAATAGGLGIASAVAPKAAPKESRNVTYRIKGFTCITCAVGLEVMLKGLKGVTRASASYPGNTVTIGFDEHVTTEKNVEGFYLRVRIFRGRERLGRCSAGDRCARGKELVKTPGKIAADVTTAFPAQFVPLAETYLDISRFHTA